MRGWIGAWWLVVGTVVGGVVGEQIQPVPPPAKRIPVEQWDYRGSSSLEPWQAQHDCELRTSPDGLVIRSHGADPFLARPVNVDGGTLLVKMRLRSASQGRGRVYWTTDQSPNQDESKAQSFTLEHDRQWHDVLVPIHVQGRLASLRLDPCQAPGEVTLGTLSIERQIEAPVRVSQVELNESRVAVTVHNHDAQTQTFTLWGQSHQLAAGADLQLQRMLDRSLPLEPVPIDLACEGFPAWQRTLFAYQPQAPVTWLEAPAAGYVLRVAPDGSMAQLIRNGQLVAALAPIVHREGSVPKLRPAVDGQAIVLEGDDVHVRLSWEEGLPGELGIELRAEGTVEGPVVRSIGSLQQGLLAGVEHLGRGETSSSRLDLETPDHLRFAPDPLLLTQPLMSTRTELGTVTLVWDDMTLQPTYAVPNFFDGSADHRLALRGRHIVARVRLGDSLEDDIVWAVQRHGLPAVPARPRSEAEQRALCVRALSGPLRTAAGWGHCVESQFGRHPFADMGSTWWRLTGEIPQLPELVPGGAHLANPAIYFVTGRAQQWLDHQRSQAESLMAQQQPDGTYRYDGPYARGHFETTALGVCAVPARNLLEYAQVTGDPRALEAACRTLDAMRRFDTPRGAQVWEVPLHTPDLLAAAHAVWAYVLGYELTGRREYLDEARRWAIQGIPYVYLWGRYPVMVYGTTPVLGATNWTEPNWIGLPVQWVGGVYAYALVKLARHDSTIDWTTLAKGILVAAEQMQYADGEYAGLLPDSFELRGQERRPWNINPCAVVSLDMAISGHVDSLSAVRNDSLRVVAPFRVTLDGETAVVEGRAGMSYQILINGQVRDVQSVGIDRIQATSSP
ncbi:MAG: hypothetical protein U0795_08155 [Pirellulales bacterium]